MVEIPRYEQRVHQEALRQNLDFKGFRIFGASEYCGFVHLLRLIAEVHKFMYNSGDSLELDKNEVENFRRDHSDDFEKVRKVFDTLFQYVHEGRRWILDLVVPRVPYNMIKEYYKFRNGIDERDGIKRHAGVLMNPIVRVVPKPKDTRNKETQWEPEDEDQGDCQVVEPAGPKRGKIRSSQCQAPTQPGSLDQWISRNQRGATLDDESPARPFSRPLSQEARPFSKPISHVIDFMKFLDSKKVIFYNKEKDYTDLP
ncbi:unnamed protein product [Caenorhabditis nigoni]